MLRTATGKAEKADWPKLVSAAREKRLLTPDDAEVLTHFNKSYRIRLKHEAGVLAEGEDDQALVSDVIHVLGHVERFCAQPLTDEAAAELNRLTTRMIALEASVSREGGRESHSP